MANRRSEIAMTDSELADLFDECRTLHVATINADGTPHLVPMWFALDDDGVVAFHTFARSQKIANLRRDRRLTCLVEAGETYSELRGAQLRGHGEIVDDPDEVIRRVVATSRRYDPTLSEADAAARAPKVAAKRVAVRVVAETVTSWDHRKLG